MPRLLSLALLVAVATAAAAPAAAEDEDGADDYQATRREWNGLSDFVSLAEGMGYVVLTPQRIDWDEIEDDDVVVMLYPTTSLDPGHMIGFLRHGARVLIADDFGKAGDTFARLGLLRHDGRPRSARLHEGNPALPVASPWDELHPLATGVEDLYTNHPAWFDVSGEADQVFGFGRGQTVVVTGRLGDGVFVAVSDPSVFINGMLAFDGNLAFAQNTLRFLAPPGKPEGGRLVVLTGEFELTGLPPSALDDATGRSVNEVLGEVDAALDEVNDYVAPPGLLSFLILIGSFLAFGLAALVLPLRRPRKMDARFSRAREEIRHGYEWLVSHFDQKTTAMNYALPAAVLRDRLELRLQPACGEGAISALSPPELLARASHAFGPEVATVTVRVARSLRRVPARAHAQMATAWPHVSRREFERLHDEVEELEEILARPGGG